MTSSSASTRASGRSAMGRVCAEMRRACRRSTPRTTPRRSSQSRAPAAELKAARERIEAGQPARGSCRSALPGDLRLHALVPCTRRHRRRRRHPPKSPASLGGSHGVPQVRARCVGAAARRPKSGTGPTARRTRGREPPCPRASAPSSRRGLTSPSGARSHPVRRRLPVGGRVVVCAAGRRHDAGRWVARCPGAATGTGWRRPVTTARSSRSRPARRGARSRRPYDPRRSASEPRRGRRGGRSPAGAGRRPRLPPRPPPGIP